MTLNTHKRCSIKSLPNHLVIHLKRFDFDFDTMQQTKVGWGDFWQIPKLGYFDVVPPIFITEFRPLED